MALTIAFDNDNYARINNKIQVTGTLTFDSSYATGGESITAANVGLAVLESLMIQSASGYTPSWDKTNGKVIVYSGQETGGAMAISSLTSTAAAATTSAQDLLTAVLPAATLAATGDRVRIRAWGITAANTQTKIHILKFGATTLVNGGTSSTASLDWLLEADVYRTGAATQEAIAHAELGPVTGTAGAITVLTRSAPTETLSGAVTISTTVTLGTASASDSTQKGLTVDYFPVGGTTGTGLQVASATDLSAITFRFTAFGV